MSVTLLHGDCMSYMAGLADGAFDLAIVDPPYGIGDSMGRSRHYEKIKWDNAPPPKEYFAEIVRVSSHQIVWGINNFENMGSGRIVWNKLGPDIGRRNTMDRFSDCELAYQSLNNRIKMFSFTYIGNVRGNEYRVVWEEDRIHPTQKPVELYRWLLHNYAKPGWRILDTHLGSGSSAIAAHEMGFDFVGIEIDADYIAAARKRVDLMTRQMVLDL